MTKRINEWSQVIEDLDEQLNNGTITEQEYTSQMIRTQRCLIGHLNTQCWMLEKARLEKELEESLSIN